ncbi:MAG TPA: hypothetical protein PLX69_04235 [Leptospiraceae bacterium]|nr:hypothetical protein [Leptospiraceae bacterium]
MREISEQEINRLFIEFYLNKELINDLCAKYNINRYTFYKLKSNHSKKSFYDYSLEEWIQSCLEQYPDSSAEDIRKYLSYVNKTEYALEEIESILSTL